jgi:hypothetical protein
MQAPLRPLPIHTHTHTQTHIQRYPFPGPTMSVLQSGEPEAHWTLWCLFMFLRWWTLESGQYTPTREWSPHSSATELCCLTF